MSLISKNRSSKNVSVCPKTLIRPELDPLLALAIAADPTLAGFTARWEKTFLEVKRMNRIETDLRRGGKRVDMFRQHRNDDLSDLDYVSEYIMSKHGPVVHELWMHWIVVITAYNFEKEISAEANIG